MSNSFSKEERVAFENLLEGFQDALVLSKAVNIYGTDGTLMERTNDTIWRPQPYIAQSQDRIIGSAITVPESTQLAVPATLGYKKSSPFTLDSLELRDALQENRLGDSAKQKIASDINLAVLSVATLQGTLVVPISTAAEPLAPQRTNTPLRRKANFFDSRIFICQYPAYSNSSYAIHSRIMGAYSPNLIEEALSGFVRRRLKTRLRTCCE